MKEFKKIIILIAVAAIIALLNAFIQKTDLITPPPKTIDKKLELMKEKVPAGITIVSYQEFYKIVTEQSKKIIDARSKEKYMAGHIDGAVSIPATNVLEASEDFMNQFGPETSVIMYCDGPECMASITVADFFKNYSYTDVSVYLEGYEAWIKKHP